MKFEDKVTEFSNSKVYRFIVLFNYYVFGWFYRLLLKLGGKE